MEKNIKSTIYLDNASTTPIDKGILDKMYEYDRRFFANPSSIYDMGEIEEMRKKIALAMQAKQAEIFFTGGGTESNNIAILGVVKKYSQDNPKTVPHIIVSSIEHASVLETARELEKEGVEVTYVEPKENGIVRPLDVVEKIKKNTVLVSIMLVNNEIGAVQPIISLAKKIKDYRKENNTVYPFLHTDACQAGNYFLVTASRLSCDLITINSSKLYGPKAVGALYVRSRTKVSQVVYGGAQEKGLRSGTQNVSGIIGMTESFVLAQDMAQKESERLTVLRDYLIKELTKKIIGIKIWGDLKERSPNNVSVYIPNISAEELVIRLGEQGVYVSSKSACSSSESDGSYVIMSVGGTKEESMQTLRITMGRNTEKKDLDLFLQKIIKILEKYAK
jgi:cysteine desulfurase